MKISYLATAALIGILSLGSLPVVAAEKVTANAPAAMPNNEGIVVSTMDATAYTYMELENGGNRFWIAAPTTKVNVGDHIRFVESMTMHNFTSKTLNRTFNKIIFVSSTMKHK